MNNKEAIDELITIHEELSCLKFCESGFYSFRYGDYLEALDIAITALEQGDVFDKIRAEIEEYKSRQLTLAIGVEDLEKGKQIALEYVLAILDKYKTESKVRE